MTSLSLAPRSAGRPCIQLGRRPALRSLDWRLVAVRLYPTPYPQKMYGKYRGGSTRMRRGNNQRREPTNLNTDPCMHPQLDCTFYSVFNKGLEYRTRSYSVIVYLLPSLSLFSSFCFVVVFVSENLRYRYLRACMLLACLLVLRRGLDLVRFVYFVWVVLSVAFLARVCGIGRPG